MEMTLQGKDSCDDLEYTESTKFNFLKGDLGDT